MAHNELNTNLVLLVQSAIDLANSVNADVEAKGYISEKTLALLNAFNEKHDELNEQLESDTGLH